MKDGKKEEAEGIKEKVQAINNELVENEKLEESVKYEPIGAYSIITNEEEFSISKVKTLEDMEFGYKNPSGEFDFVGARKKAYGTSQAKLLATILNKKQDLDALKGGQAVKIYKNKKK